MALSFLSQNELSRIRYERQKTYEAEQLAKENDKNRGGVLGGIGYSLEKIGLGLVGAVEGIWDYTAGGLAKLFGADDWAEEQFANDWVNYDHADEWFNPDSVWKTVGDITQGIGNSIPSLVAIGGITLATGGTALPAIVAKCLVGGATFLTAGLSAAGNATKEAYRQTGELGGKEFGYGALVGLTEGTVETFSDFVLGGVGGQLSKGIRSMTGDVAATAARQTFGKTLAKSFLSEGFEEVVGEFADPVFKRWTYDPTAENATLGELAYAGFVGGMSGLLMSAGGSAYSNARVLHNGSKAVTNGRVGEILQNAQNITSYEAENHTDLESFQSVSDTYTKLQESLKKTNGNVETVRQKHLLGLLDIANTAAVFEPTIQSSARNIYANADVIAQRMTEFGYTDAERKAIVVTADQIREGIDTEHGEKAFKKSFGKALRTNSVLRTIAVLDATNKLLIDAKKFSDATLRGQALASQVDINRFLEATETEEGLKQREAVAQRLGIEDWNTITADQLREKIIEFEQDGGSAQYMTERADLQQAESIAPETTQNLPEAVVLEDGAAARYSLGDNQIAVERRGDNYRVYDYTSGRLTKNLTQTELGALVSEMQTKEAQKAATQPATEQSASNPTNPTETVQAAQERSQERVNAQPATEEAAGETVREAMGSEAREIDAYARQNVEGYNKLGAANQSMIRSIIRQGRAAGVEESFVLSCARVSAHSGLNIVFNKELCFVKEDGTYADGAINFKGNRIIINPEAKGRSGEKILIHELTHAIYVKGDIITVADGVESMSAEEKENIRKRYAKVNRGSAVEVSDEINAHFAEETLVNQNILERLVAKKPTLKQKILGFFKGARADYASDAGLSGAAKRLFAQYSKLFEKFSKSNAFSNASEGTITNEATVGDFIFEMQQNAANTDLKETFSRADKEYSKVNQKTLEACREIIKRGLNVTGVDGAISQYSKGVIEFKAGDRTFEANVTVGHVEGGGRVLYDVSEIRMVKNASGNIVSAERQGKKKYVADHASGETVRHALSTIDYNSDRSFVKSDGDGQYLSIDLSTEAQRTLSSLKGVEHRKFVQEYINRTFRNIQFTMRDGRVVYVTGTGSAKISESSFLPKQQTALELNKLFSVAEHTATVEYAEHKKFARFDYYSARVEIGREMYSCVLNIGLTRGGNFYQIYDINQFKNIKKDAPVGSNQLPSSTKSLRPISSASTNSIAQNSEKSTDSNRKSENKRFALSIGGENVVVDVQEEGDLVALHNLSEQNLLKVLKLGGFPMPSIAITKADIPFTDFGDITIVFGRETIDPENLENRVYERDAWTPTVPRAEYKLNTEKAQEISNRISSYITEYETLCGSSTVRLDADAMQDYLNGWDGQIAYQYGDKFAMQYAFLRDTGVLGENITEKGADLNSIIDSETDTRRKAYNEWLDKLFDGITERKGVRNNADAFNRAGQRRSFEETHYDYTLENIVKVMRTTTPQGGVDSYASTDTLAAALAKNFSSIEDIRQAESLLSAKNQKEIAAARNEYEKAITEIVDSMAGRTTIELSTGAEEVLLELARSKRTSPMSILSYLQKEYKGIYNFNAETAQKISALFNAVGSMETDMFEAKPRRAVALSEIKQVLIPSRTPNQKLLQALRENNVPFTLYDRSFDNNTDERTAIIKRLDGIRFALSEERDTERRLSDAQWKKIVANHTRSRVFSRGDAQQIIDDVIADRLGFDEKYGNLRGKAKVVDMLFEHLNEAPKAGETERSHRLGTAIDIADYIIENTYMTDIYAEEQASEAMTTLSALRGLMHRIDLSGIKDDILHKYDRKNTINLVWGAKVGGIAPDVAAQELESYGIRLDATNAADQFFEILDLYHEARARVDEARKRSLAEVMSDKELDEIRNSIEDDIMVSFRTKGSSSALARERARMAQQNTAWKQELFEKYQKRIGDLKKANKLTNSIIDTAQYLKDIATKRKYVGADVFSAPELTVWLKNLGRMKYRSDLRKAGARQILLDYGNFYNTSNPLLYDADPNLSYIDENVLDALAFIKQNEGSAKPLSTEELQAAQVIMLSAKHLFDNYDQIIMEGKKVSVTELATQGNEILLRSKSHTDRGIFNTLYAVMNKITEPRVVIRSLENYDPRGVLTRAYKAITDGETAAGLRYIELMTNFDSFLAEHKQYKKRLSSAYITVTGTDLTVGQAISLYELSKREQAQAGLYEAGFGYIDQNGAKKSARITENDIAALEKQFTAEDKEFIAIVEDFFNVQSKQLKTKADMQILGYTNASDDFYFPIKRDKGTIARNITDARSIMADWANVYNFSFNKDVKTGAKNKLFITGVYDVVTRHAKQLSTYAELTVPLKNFSQIYSKNIGTKTNAVSMRNTLNEQIWGRTDDYLSKLFKDIQGTATSNSMIEKLRGAYAKYQLGANLKVIVSQVTSYPTAGIYLDVASMTRGAVMRTNWEAMDKYCPYARVRNYERGIVRAEGVVDKVGKVGDVLTKPIQWTDRATIGKLWNACQVQIERNGGAKVGTQENMEKAGVLLEDVIRLTQPNYTNTERSELMRSDSDIVRSFTMFTSVPLKQLSRFVESIGEYRALRQAIKSGNADADMQARYKQATKQLRRTLGSITIANLMYCLVGQFFKWLYDKDRKDKDGNEIGFMQDYFNDFVSTSIGMFPVVKDIYNYFANDYEFNNFAYETVNSILSASQELFDLATKAAGGEVTETSDYMKALRNSLYAIGQLTGLPFRNINNMISGLIKRFDPAAAYKYNSLFYNARYSSDIKAALEKGDAKLADTIMSLLLDERGASGISDTAREKMIDLYEKGYDVLPRTVGDTITFNGEERTISAKERETITAAQETASAEVGKIVSSRTFKNLSEAAQAKAIKKTYDSCYEEALAGLFGVPVDSEFTIVSKAIGITKTAPAVAAASELTSEKINGTTVQGSRKKKVISYLQAQSMTDAERLLLLYYLGYKIGDGEYKGMTAQAIQRLLAQYVTQRKLSREEKTALAEMCGLTVKNGRVYITAA